APADGIHAPGERRGAYAQLVEVGAARERRFARLDETPELAMQAFPRIGHETASGARALGQASRRDVADEAAEILLAVPAHRLEEFGQRGGQRHVALDPQVTGDPAHAVAQPVETGLRGRTQRHLDAGITRLGGCQPAIGIDGEPEVGDEPPASARLDAQPYPALAERAQALARGRMLV